MYVNILGTQPFPKSSGQWFRQPFIYGQTNRKIAVIEKGKDIEFIKVVFLYLHPRFFIYLTNKQHI